MKKILICFALLCPFAFAVDFEAVEESGSVLDGALRGALNPAFSYAEYIAGYGLHFTAAASFFDEGESQTAITKITDLLPALASTVQGLEQGEWVSAAYSADTHILVRLKPNQPESLEVWVDGVKQ